MAYLIGTDEAGYGPNYGPLVVAATVWKVDAPCDPDKLYAVLRRCVTASPAKASKRRVVWADSKVVYNGGSGRDDLERGALAALGLVNRMPSQWCELWPALDPHCAPRVDELPWHVGYESALPLWTDRADLENVVPCLLDGMASCGVRLVAVLSRIVFPGEFNALVAETASKSEALSRITLRLVAQALQFSPDDSVRVYCDKHGARNHYLPLLQAHFPDDWIEAVQESGPTSRYRFGSEARRTEIGFWVKGERFLPTALASMVAKYLREAAMLPFNEFWCARVPGLAPTAGYPNDAQRFRRQIAAAQAQLGIDDHLLWRCR